LHDLDGDAGREPMIVAVRTVGAAVGLLLIAACAQEPEPPAPEPVVGVSRADADFARFMNDPTNPESWRWLCRAAVGGHTAAQFTVAVRYRDGLPPVAQNLPRAFLWFTAAQKSGLTAAVLAREEVEKRLPEDKVEALRKRSKPLAEADCRQGRISSKKKRTQ
jgi:hypothetical protein